LDDLDEVLQRITSVDTEPALAGVAERADDLHPTLARVLLQDVGLVLRRVLLVFGRHPHVLSRTDMIVAHDLASGAVEFCSRARCLADRTYR
jgi:hypothetical protein